MFSYLFLFLFVVCLYLLIFPGNCAIIQTLWEVGDLPYAGSLLLDPIGLKTLEEFHVLVLACFIEALETGYLCYKHSSYLPIFFFMDYYIIYILSRSNVPPKPLELGSWNFERMFNSLHLSHVACIMSPVAFHVSHVPYIFFTKCWS